MTRWAIGRLAQAGVTYAVTLVLLFLLMRLAPGDPLARLDADVAMSPEEQSALRRRFGLDQPLARQLGAWGAGVLQGDLGVSIGHYPDRVADLLRSRLPASLLLGATVLTLNFSVGVWLGVVQARHRGRRLDRWLTRVSLAGYATPSFWLGLLLISLVSLRWGWLPAAQMTDPLLPADAPLSRKAADLVRHLILPAVTLSAVTIAGTMRLQRTAMIEVLREDFVRAARARGLSEARVLWGHAWRNAVFPVLTLFGLALPMLVTGAVFVESVFNWPGIGGLAADAIAGRDYPLLMGTALLVSGAVIAGGVVADLGYQILDPRVRPA